MPVTSGRGHRSCTGQTRSPGEGSALAKAPAGGSRRQPYGDGARRPRRSGCGRWQAAALRQYDAAGARGLPGHRDAGRRQDDLRAGAGPAAARPPRRRPGHRGLPDRSSAHPVGRGGRAGRARARPDAVERGRAAAAGPGRLRHDLRPGRDEAAAARGPGDRGAQPGHPRRGAPRRRRAVLGRRGRRGVRAGRAAAVPDRHPVSHPGRRADPVRALRADSPTAASPAGPTTPTATAQALADGVVRPVVFAAYTGTSRWRNSAGEVIAASLTEAGTKSTEAAAWRTALNPRGQWVPHVIAAMDERITQLREAGMPDAAGLLLATDQADAHAYAEIVERVTGHAPVVIVSDDPDASAKITPVRPQRRAHRGLRAHGVRGGRPAARRVPGLDDVLPHAAVLRPGRRPRGARARPARVGDRVPAGRPAAAGAGGRPRGRAQPRHPAAGVVGATRSTSTPTS